MTTPFTLLRRAALCLVLVATAGALRAADMFEGRIDMKMVDAKHPDQPHVFNYAMKQNKLRFDIPADEKNSRQGMSHVAVILDMDKRETVTLLDSNERKIAMRHPLRDHATSKADPDDAHGMHTSVPVATGRTEKILGYPSTEYKVTDENGDVHLIWLAKGLGRFMYPTAQGPRGGAVPPGWESFARDGNFFPLRVVSLDKSGKETSRLEVTKIDKTTVPDSAFSTEGYSEMQMPSFGGGNMLRGLMGR